MSAGRSKKSAAARSVEASSGVGPRGEQAPQPMDAPGRAGGRVPAGVGRRCSASRSAEESSRWRASAAQAVGGAQAPGAGAARRRTADRGEEFDPTRRGRRRRGKPPRSPRRRRRLAVSAAAPKTETPVPTVGWSARNSARRAGATAAPAWRRAPPRADRRREFAHRMGSMWAERPLLFLCRATMRDQG